MSSAGPKSGSSTGGTWNASPYSSFTGSNVNSTNYGFSIPANATINGVAVTYSRSTNLVAGGGSLTVGLLNCSGSTTTGDSVSPGWSGTPTLGGSTILWGTSGTITPTVVNSSSFGCSFSLSGSNASSSSVYAGISSITMTVYYTVGGKYVVSCIC